MSGYKLNNKYLINDYGRDEDLVLFNFKEGDTLQELDYGSNLVPIDKSVFRSRKKELLEMINVCDLILNLKE